MIVDVNKLKAKGVTEEHIVLPFEPSDGLLSLPGAHIESAELEADLFLYPRRVKMEGVVRYVIVGECSRCLAPAKSSEQMEVNAEFTSDAGGEYPIKAGRIDLRPAAEEAVVVSSPKAIYCREDCKGLCPVCGADLNAGECSCKK